MILNYAEAAAYATAIAKYIIVASFGTMLFSWAWENVITYFHWFDSSTADLDDVVDAIVELQSTIEQDRTIELIA